MALTALLRNPEQVEAEVTQRVAASLRLRISETVAVELRKVLTGSEEDSGGLSPREIQVLQAVADGMYYKEIAAELRIAEKTIRNHMSHIMEKLEVGTSSGAVAKGFRLGVLS